MNRNVRKITDGAMMVAIAGVFLLINRYLGGMLEELLLFVFPLPMVFYSAKYGMKDSWPVFAAMVLITLVVSTPQTIFYVASESLIGLIYGSGIKKKTSTRKLVWITILISVIANMITMLIYASFFGYDIAGEMEVLQDMFVQMENASGMSLSNTVDVTSFLRNILYISIILTGIMQGLVTHLLARLMLKRLRYEIPKDQDVIHYFPPIWSGYLGMACFLGYYWTLSRPFEDAIIQNVVQAVGMCGVFYLRFCGMLGVITFMSTHIKGSRKWSGLIALFLTLISSLFMVFFGFLYITTSMHKNWLMRAEGGANA